MIESEYIIKKCGKSIDTEKVKIELRKMNNCKCSYTGCVGKCKYDLYIEFSDRNIQTIPISDEGKYLGCTFFMIYGYNYWYYLDNENVGSNSIALGK